ncbi:hypothetical protein Q5P01_022785 [Channa striata]|uniref:Uncharacterized protein n=1 Tax=Channa striata TaxID=64152 RepID=A0AA88LRN5_CHASR|nr:hypothetical protein Q5P01_022785 [Channa striata]
MFLPVRDALGNSITRSVRALVDPNQPPSARIDTPRPAWVSAGPDPRPLDIGRRMSLHRLPVPSPPCDGIHAPEWSSPALYLLFLTPPCSRSHEPEPAPRPPPAPGAQRPIFVQGRVGLRSSLLPPLRTRRPAVVWGGGPHPPKPDGIHAAESN